MREPPVMALAHSGKLIVRCTTMILTRTAHDRSLGASWRTTFRLPLLILALLAAAGFGADALLVLNQPLPPADLTVERSIQAVHWGPVLSVFAAVDWFEGLKQVAVAVLGVLAVAIWNRRGLLLMIWGALSGAVYQLIEIAAHRPRPEANLVRVIRHTAGWSFPSGHALFFSWFIAYLLVIFGRRLPRPLYAAGWALQGVVLALVGIGRIDTAEHWPSDVLAGLLLGAAWTLFGLSVRRLSDPVLDGR